MVNKRKIKLSVREAWLAALCLHFVAAQIELAPANMGLKLAPQDGYVKAVPGRNPNMPPWFEDLGVDSFGQILGHTSIDSLKADEPAKSPIESMAVPNDKIKEIAEDGLLTAADGKEIINADESEDQVDDGSESLDNVNSGNSTETTQTPLSNNKTETTTEGNLPEAHIKVLGIPYPKEEPILIYDSPMQKNHNEDIVQDRTPLNSLRSSVGSGAEFQSDTTLLPPPEKMAEEQYNPKPRNIPLWKPKSNAPEPPPLFILPKDNPKRILRSNIDMFRPMVATSTWTTKVSGQVVTSTTVSTVEQSALKFKSCIYGCPEMTSSDSLVGTTTIITVLPYQLPCSLVSCPPCPACFQSTISVSVCPFIATVPAKARTTFVNGPTITIIRSTVTRTKCTETRTISAKPTVCSCPTEIATVTVTVEGSHRRSSSGSLASGSGADKSSEKSPYVDPSLIMDFPSNQSEKPVPEVIQEVEGADLQKKQASTITETILSTVYATPSKRLPSLTITKTVVSERIVVTVTTTLLPVTTSEELNTGVCSTFIICNPTQFTCPAQVTNLPQIKAIVQSIMDGQEKFGSGGAGSRRLTPNGAYIDDMGPPSLFGDGLEKVGGLAPVNAFGFGPGGMFEKALGTDLIPPKESTTEVLLPPKPTDGATVSAAAAKIAPSISISSTRIVEAQPTGEGQNGAVRRSAIKKSRKQQTSSSAASWSLPALLSPFLTIIVIFLAL